VFLAVGATTLIALNLVAIWLLVRRSEDILRTGWETWAFVFMVVGALAAVTALPVIAWRDSYRPAGSWPPRPADPHGWERYPPRAFDAFVILTISLALLIAGVAFASWSETQRSETNRDASPQSSAKGTRVATILGVNDIYRINGVNNGASGNLARLRALREELEIDSPDLLVLHGGDVVSPSFLSREFYGEQMVDVLNVLDGAEGTLDERMFVTFGNHEFDDSDCAEPQLLRRRIRESEFRWLGSNIDWNSCEVPMLTNPNVIDSALVESGGIVIGLFGLTIEPNEKVRNDLPEHETPSKAAERMTESLRDRGAEVVVAVTHLETEQDKEILRLAGESGPDLIVGGHDHDKRKDSLAPDRAMFKADADNRSASVIKILIAPDGEVTITQQYRELRDPYPKDPEVQALIDDWLARHAELFCNRSGDEQGCLETELVETRTELQGEELKTRAKESSLANWITDQMMASVPDGCSPDVAFINAGTFRLNYDIPAETMLTRRTVEETFGFPVTLRATKTSGSDLQSVVSHSLKRSGSGGWAHFSGLSFAYRDGQGDDPPQLVGEILVDGEPLDPKAEYTVLTTAFILGRNDDGYPIKPVDPGGACAEVDIDLKKHVLETLERLRKEGQSIGPVAEGRICNMSKDSDCIYWPSTHDRSSPSSADIDSS
jgi:2',3'-cyclic-nucleotide 2'-phosphodiesterase (5'-nucleotidase family)